MALGMCDQMLARPLGQCDKTVRGVYLRPGDPEQPGLLCSGAASIRASSDRVQRRCTSAELPCRPPIASKRSNKVGIGCLWVLAHRLALAVLVGQAGAQRLHHRPAGEVLAGNQLDAAPGGREWMESGR